MIIRTKTKCGFTVLPNEFVLDKTISDKARGLLIRLLCKPNDWKFDIDEILGAHERYHATRSALKELVDRHYIHRFVCRDNGKIVGNEYLIYDLATPRVDAQAMFEKIYGNGGVK